jgi:hypothetical protein
MRDEGLPSLEAGREGRQTTTLSSTVSVRRAPLTRSVPAGISSLRGFDATALPRKEDRSRTCRRPARGGTTVETRIGAV